MCPQMISNVKMIRGRKKIYPVRRFQKSLNSKAENNKKHVCLKVAPEGLEAACRPPIAGPPRGPLGPRGTLGPGPNWAQLGPIGPWALGLIGPWALLGPGPYWALGPLGPGPYWALGPIGPWALLGPGPSRAQGAFFSINNRLLSSKPKSMDKCVF